MTAVKLVAAAILLLVFVARLTGTSLDFILIERGFEMLFERFSCPALSPVLAPVTEPDVPAPQADPIGEFTARGLACGPFPDGAMPDAGGICWCLRAGRRIEILFHYSVERNRAEAGERVRRHWVRCGPEDWDLGESRKAWDALLPEGKRIVSSALTEARAENPDLVIGVPLPAMGAGGWKGMVMEAQVILHMLEFSRGRADGIFGPRTASALKAFRSEAGVEDGGGLDLEDMGLLRNSVLYPADIPIPLEGE
jgi:hypothetical protein